jgi:hypothetical protein
VALPSVTYEKLLPLLEPMPIEYSRGKITVLDRARLEARACECYAVVKKEYDRLLPRVLPEALLCSVL